jgi:hypothetical protein
MSEKRYYIKREGNHFKLSPQSQEEPLEPPTSVQSNAPKRVKRSIWSMIGNFFSLILSGLIMIIGFLIATPFFLLSVLWNWIIMFIGLSIFWSIAGVIYYGTILDYEVNTNLIFNNTSIPILLIVALIGAVMSTIGRMRD